MNTKILPLLLFTMLIACDQKDQRIEYKTCVRVKLHKELCGQAILEILDPANTDKGQDWTDWNGVEYQNVFSTVLPCTIPNRLSNETGAIQPGVEFLILFADSQDDNGCAMCKALLVGPEKFSHINIVTNCTEEQE